MTPPDDRTNDSTDDSANPYSPPSVAVDVPEEPSPFASPAAPGEAVYIPGGNAAKAAVALLFVALALHLVSAAYTGYLYRVIGLVQMGQPLDQEHANTLDAVFMVLAFLPVLVRIACAVPFCIWFVRAYKNLLALGIYSLTFPAGWAAGGWFVPFLNLVRPYQIAKEIWLGSQRGTAIVDDVVRKGDARLVGLWWTLWLLGVISTQIGSKMMPAEGGDLGMLQASYVVMALGDLLLAGAAFAAVKLVRGIEARQADAYRALQETS